MNLYTGLVPFAIAFLAVAVVASLVAVGLVGDFVVRNRRVRLARRESVITYYRGLRLSH